MHTVTTYVYLDTLYGEKSAQINFYESRCSLSDLLQLRHYRICCHFSALLVSKGLLTELPQRVVIDFPTC